MKNEKSDANFRSTAAAFRIILFYFVRFNTSRPVKLEELSAALESALEVDIHTTFRDKFVRRYRSIKNPEKLSEEIGQRKFPEQLSKLFEEIDAANVELKTAKNALLWVDAYLEGHPEPKGESNEN